MGWRKVMLGIAVANSKFKGPFKIDAGVKINLENNLDTMFLSGNSKKKKWLRRVKLNVLFPPSAKPTLRKKCFKNIKLIQWLLSSQNINPRDKLWPIYKRDDYENEKKCSSNVICCISCVSHVKIDVAFTVFQRSHVHRRVDLRDGLLISGSDLHSIRCQWLTSTCKNVAHSTVSQTMQARCRIHVRRRAQRRVPTGQ